MEAIRIRAVGDDLIHRQLYQAAEVEPGAYDFHGMYDPVAELVAEADVVRSSVRGVVNATRGKNTKG